MRPPIAGGHCATCHEALDQFGICPFADPETARLAGRGPVSCGRTADQNAVVVAVEIAHALKPDVEPREPEHRLPNFMGIAGNQR